MKGRVGDPRLAQSEEHVILDPWVMNSSPTFCVEIKKERKRERKERKFMLNTVGI